MLTFKNQLVNTNTNVHVVNKVPFANVQASFADAVKQTLSTPTETRTQNGNIAFSGAGSALVDFFFQGGAMRNWSVEKKRNAFRAAYAEDKLIALKILFYFRDVREGQGERDLFRDIVSELAVFDPKTLSKNLELFSEYGRWDDLFVLLGSSLKAEVIRLLATQLECDWSDEFPSLLAKWMKSENTSSKKSREIGKVLRTALGLTPREYRLMLSKLRAKIDIVETKISKGEYANIDYSKLPSNAAMKYRTAFFKHDEERYKAYLDALVKPVAERSVELKDVKVNAKTLYPYEIVSKLIGYRVNAQDVMLHEAQWQALPDYFKGKSENMLVIADTSGSMSGRPMDVSVSLAIYAAERNVGAFQGIWMNFSSRPSFQVLKGETLYEKIRNMDFNNWDMSTNLNLALEKVLEMGVQSRLPQEQMPKKLVIVSDMQFDECVQNGRDGGLLNTVRRKFQAAGYEMPEIVFWNVNAHAGTCPIGYNQHGVALVSGFSPQMFSNLFGDLGTPMDLVLKVVGGQRYDAVVV